MENQASIKIMNIRYLILALDEEPRFDRLPASGFLYAVCGSATFQLDEIHHQAK
ncbi:hypothetical protein ABE354_09920 [Brevibacillus laterosporus]|uniref:hypothetical protein n=1 Tax=Brevibacillus laterosporus TaxID=1465 RepID=UPI003D219680